MAERRQLPVTRQLVQIDAPHFCAGLEMADNNVSNAAPIIKWMIGKSRYSVRAYCQSRGWRSNVVKQWDAPNKLGPQYTEGP
jgi:hypothetical protein